MPDEIEKGEKGGSRLIRLIALSTALLAALAAIASLEAGATVNEALVLKSESTRLQSQASDQWAYYQAKEIETERDAKSYEADALLERHHRYAGAVALFQVAIALGAIAALTRVRAVWVGSMVVGGAGIVLSLMAIAT